MSMLSWSNVEKLSTLLGLFGSFFALFAWLQAKRINKNVKQEQNRLNQEIKIVLQGEDDSHTITLPFALRRRELARSELLGLIGMLPTKEPKERFEIRYLSTEEFRDSMSNMQDAEDDAEMKIICTNDEIDQFAVEMSANDRN